MQTLANSGLTANRLALARLLARFPVLGRVLRLRLSPELLGPLNLLEPTLENGLLYASAVTWMRTGKVMKSVGLNRNALADACVIRLARREGLTRLCDMGVSDGSASIRLLESLPESRVRLFDKYNFFLLRRRFLGCEAFSAMGERIYLRIGPVLAYVYQASRPALQQGEPLRRVPVKNPLLRRFQAEIEDFDLFEDDLDESFQLIKCCNCLNLEFYPADKLSQGVRRLLGRLEEGGYLLIGQNHPDYREEEAYFVLQRRGAGSFLVEERNGHRLLDYLKLHDPELVAHAGTGAQNGNGTDASRRDPSS
jgi:hypothetical protein